MVSASSRALNAICPSLPNLDFQTSSPVNSWLLYPQHVTSITARGHLESEGENKRVKHVAVVGGVESRVD